LELALEGVAVELAAPRADEDLANHQHRGARRLAERAVVDRNVAPAAQRLALVGDGTLPLTQPPVTRRAIARPAHNAHASSPRLRRRARCSGRRDPAWEEVPILDSLAVQSYETLRQRSPCGNGSRVQNHSSFWSAAGCLSRHRLVAIAGGQESGETGQL